MLLHCTFPPLPNLEAENLHYSTNQCLLPQDKNSQLRGVSHLLYPIEKKSVPLAPGPTRFPTFPSSAPGPRQSSLYPEIPEGSKRYRKAGIEDFMIKVYQVQQHSLSRPTRFFMTQQSWSRRTGMGLRIGGPAKVMCSLESRVERGLIIFSLIHRCLYLLNYLQPICLSSRHRSVRHFSC